MPPYSDEKSIKLDVNETIQSPVMIESIDQGKDLEPLRTVSFEDAVNEIGVLHTAHFYFLQITNHSSNQGFGKVQIKLLLVTALILMAVLNETMGIAFLIPAAQCDLSLTSERKGLLTGMTFLGE